MHCPLGKCTNIKAPCMLFLGQSEHLVVNKIGIECPQFIPLSVATLINNYPFKEMPV